MAWQTKSLKQMRIMARDHVASFVQNASALLVNPTVRVLSEVVAAFAHLNLQFLENLKNQIFVSLADEDFLYQHAEIWNVTRKSGILAEGSAVFTGTQGAVIPAGTILVSSSGIEYETTLEITIGASGVSGALRALDQGESANLAPGDTLSFVNAIAGVDGSASVETMVGGVDDEDIEAWRSRILERIRFTPMGGNERDWRNWCLSVPGCTRAIVKGNVMGDGTVSIWPFFDDLRSYNNGIPEQSDINALQDYLDEVRPVTVKQVYINPPTLYPINIQFTRIYPNTSSTQAAIEAAVRKVVTQRGYDLGNASIMYRSWIAEAASQAVGEDNHDLAFNNTEIPVGSFASVHQVIFPPFSS